MFIPKNSKTRHAKCKLACSRLADGAIVHPQGKTEET